MVKLKKTLFKMQKENLITVLNEDFLPITKTDPLVPKTIFVHLCVIYILMEYIKTSV